MSLCFLSCLCPFNKNKWGPMVMFWTPFTFIINTIHTKTKAIGTLLKLSSFVFHTKEQCNNMVVIKWWQKFNLRANYPFKCKYFLGRCTWRCTFWTIPTPMCTSSFTRKHCLWWGLLEVNEVLMSESLLLLNVLYMPAICVCSYRFCRKYTLLSLFWRHWSF